MQKSSDTAKPSCSSYKTHASVLISTLSIHLFSPLLFFSLPSWNPSSPSFPYSKTQAPKLTIPLRIQACPEFHVLYNPTHILSYKGFHAKEDRSVIQRASHVLKLGTKQKDCTAFLFYSSRVKLVPWFSYQHYSSLSSNLLTFSPFYSKNPSSRPS